MTITNFFTRASIHNIDKFDQYALFFPLITYIIASLLLLFHQDIPFLLLPSCLIVTTYIFWRFIFENRKLSSCLFNMLLIIVIFSICSLSAHFLFDLSWDGQTYHQTAILQLHDGWNPYYATLSNTVQHSIWANHYPKASWIMAATILNFTNSIEASKCINLYFIVVSFLVSLTTFDRLKIFDRK